MIKKLFLFCIVCTFFRLGLSQTTWQRDSLMYLAAYNYIVNDSINKNRIISVADSIVDLDMIWEWGLDNYPEEREKLRSYWEATEYECFKPYYSPLLFFLFRNRNAETSNAVVFFSPIVYSILKADLEFYDENSIGRNYKFHRQSYMFGTSYQYLFLFNEDGSIKKALRGEFIQL